MVLLMHPDGAVHPVVHDEDDDRKILLDCGREFLRRHHEAAVPREADNHPFRKAQLSRDGRRQSVSHDAGLWRQLRAGLPIAKEPVQPYRIIACAVGDDRVVGEALAQMSDDFGKIQTGHVRLRILIRDVVGPRLGAPTGPPFRI